MTSHDDDLKPFPTQGGEVAAELEQTRFNDQQDRKAQVERDSSARRLRKSVRKGQRPAAGRSDGKAPKSAPAPAKAVPEAPAAAPAPVEDKPIIADGDTILTLGDLELLRKIAGNRGPSSIPPSAAARPHHHH